MNSLILLAQAANSLDPSSVGVSVTSLVGSLGAAGAAVSVTYYFLNFLKDHGEKQNRLLDDFKTFHGLSQGKFQDQLDRLTDRQEALQRTYQEQITRLNDSQNLLLRDAIMAMRSVEKTMDNATSIIQGIEKTVSSLQVAIGAMDTIIRRVGEFQSGQGSGQVSGPGPKSSSRSHARENSQ